MVTFFIGTQYLPTTRYLQPSELKNFTMPVIDLSYTTIWVVNLNLQTVLKK